MFSAQSKAFSLFLQVLVHDFLTHTAARLPDKLALVCRGRRFTYAELEAMSNRFANALIRHGVRHGDRVALQLPNSVEAVVALFGVLKAGAVFVMINPVMKHEKLCYILNNCQATALVAEAASLAANHFMPAGSEVPSLRAIVSRTAKGRPTPDGTIDFDTIETEFPATPPPKQNVSLDLACLIYTSGSTGEPKGVMCDHSNVTFATGSIVEYLKNREEDVVLSALPLAFSYGLYQLLAMVKVGGTLVLEDSFAFPVLVLQRMSKEGVTGFAGVPTIYALLVSLDLTPYDLSKLRYLTNAAAALPVDHVRRVRQKFPNVELFLMHGLTEVARTVYLDPREVDRRPDSVGKAIPGTEIWLADDAGQRVGPGEVGEMVVRGPNVMRGYWNDPEGTRVRFRPGDIPGERLCYSGDLFRSDEEGFLYFVSRKDDIIKSRGEKVAPREIENVLCSLAGIREAAVVGVPDPILGEAIKAYVVPSDGPLTVNEVLIHCRAHLEEHMIPKYVEFRVELPKTGSGKIAKVELRADAGLIGHKERKDRKEQPEGG